MRTALLDRSRGQSGTGKGSGFVSPIQRPPQRRHADGKLDELVDELGKRRLNLGKTMAVLSMVLVGLGSSTTIAADGPSAITHIMRLIGVDKESEDTAVSRLAPPPKALPAPPQKPPPRVNARPPVNDLDDDIPF